MTFDSIDKLLKIILSQPQWQEQKRFHELKKYWYEIVNHKVAQHTRPVSIKKEVLYIATSNAVWAQELSLQRRNLVKKINNRVEIPLENLHFASMKWYSNYIESCDLEDNKNEIHPSLTNPLPKRPDQVNTPQEALKSWFEQIKTRSTDWQACPRCQRLCPQGELKRWDICAICFRDDHF